MLWSPETPKIGGYNTTLERVGYKSKLLPVLKQVTAWHGLGGLRQSSVLPQSCTEFGHKVTQCLVLK